jgi:tartronate-semialdehyde synthase
MIARKQTQMNGRSHGEDAAIDAAVRILEKEGVTCAFGVPGAAINPLYSALKKRGSINHILARHVEGASHMAKAIPAPRRAISASASARQAPAGTDMITGLIRRSPIRFRSFASPGKRRGRVCTRKIFRPFDIESIANR